MAESVIELTILMPCLNEVRTLAVCISNAKLFIQNAGIDAEIVVSDNGSTDGSQALARSLGARVIDVPVLGYGAALSAGISAARGRYVIMGDSDDSYDFARLELFLESLRNGADLVMGNRFKGGIARGAMPALHRYLGNPVLSGLGRLFFQCPAKDLHCGLRGFLKTSILKLNLRTTGMEFASEMVIKASLKKINIVEVPTILRPDGRDRPPHLRSWRDGWRHLKFMLLFSPKWLFLYPGLALFAVGLLGMAVLANGPLTFQRLGFGLNTHTLIYASSFVVVGLNFALYSLIARAYAADQGLLPHSPSLSRYRRLISLEVGALVSLFLILAGITFAITSLMLWRSMGFGAVSSDGVMRIVVVSTTLIVSGFELLMASMFLGVLDLRNHSAPQNNATI